MGKAKQVGRNRVHFPGEDEPLMVLAGPRKKQQRQNYAHKKSQDRGNGRGNTHFIKYPSLAEGQKSPAIQKLLKERFARLTVIIYGPRMSGTYDFEEQGDFIPPPQSELDPMEATGRIYVGDLFDDLFTRGFVCTEAKFKGHGDAKGKNYLYFRLRSDIKPDKKTGRKHYLRPAWDDYIYLNEALRHLEVHKVQLMPPVSCRGGMKHTLKFFIGAPHGQIKKPVWKPVSRQWVLEAVHPEIQRVQTTG